MKLAFNVYNPFIIETGTEGPVVLISAGVHGDEYEPMIAAFNLIELVEQNLLRGKIIIVPVTNIDAYKATSRVGSDGYDLARICPGNEQGTPSEKAAFAISNLIRQADYYIDLHTGGKILNLYPLSGYMLHASPAVLEKQQWMAIAFGLPVVWGTDSHLDGRTLSVARDAEVPAIYVEYGGGEPFNNAIVEAYVSGCLNILAGLSMVAKKFEEYSPLYWVEDHTPNKGHLQSKMPALANGIFIPDVKPGAFVEKGDRWGRVVDLDTKGEVIVLAEESGMVLFQRCTSFVQKSDSLGGVLPISEPGKKIIV